MNPKQRMTLSLIETISMGIVSLICVIVGTILFLEGNIFGILFYIPALLGDIIIQLIQIKTSIDK